MIGIRNFLPRLMSHFTKVFFALFFAGVVFLATAINASAKPDIYVSLTNKVSFGHNLFTRGVGEGADRLTPVPGINHNYNHIHGQKFHKTSYAFAKTCSSKFQEDLVIRRSYPLGSQIQ